MKAVRAAEIGSDHYLVLLKLRLIAKRSRKRGMDKRVNQLIRVGKVKDGKVRSQYQAMIRELYYATESRECSSEEEVEAAWMELKDGLVEAARNVCGVGRSRKEGEKRTKWWNEEVKKAIRKKKFCIRGYWIQVQTKQGGIMRQR